MIAGAKISAEHRRLVSGQQRLPYEHGDERSARGHNANDSALNFAHPQSVPSIYEGVRDILPSVQICQSDRRTILRASFSAIVFANSESADLMLCPRSTVFILLLFCGLVTPVPAAEMPWIGVADDKQGFALVPSGRPFVPWGVNYDHDRDGRLLEDYWSAEWPAVEAHFQQIKDLGANVVRVHLQLGKFMRAADEPDEQALATLDKLVKLAERLGLYLDLTGLGCYHKHDVPAWYDRLDETGRWEVQANFWKAVAGRVASSPAIFFYDLMNEPVVPGGRRNDGDWLGPAFAGKHFVQFITLDQRGRPRPEIARQWIHRLVSAIRAVDSRHLISVGLVDWSLDRPGLTSGFVPDKVSGELDFLCVHLYPESRKFDDAVAVLRGFQVGKPLIVEETFPLKCSPNDLDRFIADSVPHASGWISFYWGTPTEQLRRSSKIGDIITAQWLDLFAKRARIIAPLK